MGRSREKAAKWEEAVKLLHKMTGKGIGPDVVCYSSVISACEKGGQADIALSLLAEMKAEGIRSDAISYNSAIAACGKGRRKLYRYCSLVVDRDERGRHSTERYIVHFYYQRMRKGR